MVIERSDLLKKILHWLTSVRRLIPWAVELSEFDIEYVPKKAIKAQVPAKVLANFVEGEGEEPEEEIKGGSL